MKHAFVLYRLFAPIPHLQSQNVSLIVGKNRQQTIGAAILRLD